MPPPTPFPGADHRIAASGTARGASPRAVLAALLIATAVAALFGSRPLLAWTETLPDSPLAAPLHSAAVAWNDATGRLGVAGFYDDLRAGLRRIERSGATDL